MVTYDLEVKNQKGILNYFLEEKILSWKKRQTKTKSKIDLLSF